MHISRPRGGDAGRTLGREAEGVLQSLWFHRATQGLQAQRATFRILAERDPDVDAALASAVGCSPPPRSLTPPRPPLSDQRGRVARGCGAAQSVRLGKPSLPRSASTSWLLRTNLSDAVPIANVASLVRKEQRFLRAQGGCS